MNLAASTNPVLIRPRRSLRALFSSLLTALLVVTASLSSLNLGHGWVIGDTVQVLCYATAGTRVPRGGGTTPNLQWYNKYTVAGQGARRTVSTPPFVSWYSVGSIPYSIATNPVKMAPGRVNWALCLETYVL